MIRQQIFSKVLNYPKTKNYIFFLVLCIAKYYLIFIYLHKILVCHQSIIKSINQKMNSLIKIRAHEN